VVPCLCFAANSGGGQDFRLESVGVRGGFSREDTSRDFYQAEVFGNWRLPWSLDLGKQWSLGTRLDLTTGWLTDDGKDAALGSLGPSFVLERERLPLSLDVGASPTLISRHRFPEQNIGAALQFTSHVGVEWRFAEHWSVGYRFQHMSNADLARPNPGLNMHLFSLSYLF
jgi:lipid A 3-O-deacylase